ncbi:hypothetical protein niasHT_025796 [Heterodera trifolii]|uniref:polynucleotide adenylyltransferase n=1 Tax=Heterodera trifolii TaxID=157864 RepID=A0ABD2KRT7_9BILA
MHDFLEVLEKNIGKKNTEKGTQRQRILVENYAALLTDSLVEDKKLCTEFKRRARVRQRLRKMFEFAEGNLGIFEDEFWNIFNGFNKNEEQWQKEESEKETMGKRKEKRKLAEKEKREIDINDALLFLEKVKSKFANEMQNYAQFLKIMRKFRERKVNSAELMKKIENLFEGDFELIKEFMRFTVNKFEETKENEAESSRSKSEGIKGKRKENESAEKDGGEEAQSDGWKLIKQIGEQSEQLQKQFGKTTEIYDKFVKTVRGVAAEMDKKQIGEQCIGLICTGGEIKILNSKQNEIKEIYGKNPSEIKNYLECPAEVNSPIEQQQQTEEDLAEAKKDADAFALSSAYFDLLSSVTSPSVLSNGPFLLNLRRLEISSSVWYYEESARELFAFADSLDDRTAQFVRQLDKRREMWQKTAEAKLEGATKLCLSTRIYWIHFFVLVKLLTKSNRLRAFFCHGFGVVSASDLKERLRWIIRENALLALENAHPQLMHFEQCNVNSQLFLLITQFGFRSETAMAEGFESRIYLPSILDEIQEFEKNCCGKMTAKKIVEMKNVVFGWLAKGGAKDFRLALCQLFHLRNFMRENAVRKKSETEIAKWWPKECDESEGTAIREAIGQMRSEQKKANFVLIKNTVEQSDWFAKSIREESGAKVKLWKHLDGDHDMFRQLLDTGRLLRPTVFHDDNLLYSYYSDVLFGACQTVQSDGLLRTDIFIFARWLDITFKNLFLFSHASAANGRKMGERKGREWLERLTLILGDKKRAGKEKKTEKSKEEKKDRETDEGDQEMQEQFGQWHFDTLQSLINRNRTFKEMLREGIQSNEKAIELIMTLLNGKTNANRMMQILGITTKHTVIEEEKGERVQRGILEREEIESKKDVNAGTETKKRVKKKKGIRNNEKATEENNTGKEIETEETQSPIKTGKEIETEETQSPIKTGKETETKQMGNSTCREGDTEKKPKNSEICQKTDEWTNNLREKINSSKIKLKLFENDHFLTAKIEEFLSKCCQNEKEKNSKNNSENKSSETDESKSLIQMVNVGIYANEIWHRLVIIEQIEGDEKEGKELGLNWRRLKGTELANDANGGKANLAHLEDKLHKLLRQIVMAMEGKENKSDISPTAEERRAIKEHLYLHKLAFLRAEGAVQLAEPIETTLMTIFKLEEPNPSVIGQMAKRFEKILKGYIKMKEQRKIDGELFLEYKSDREKAEKETEVTKMAEHWQEMNFNKELKNERMEKSELVKKGLISTETSDQNLQNVVSQMEELITKWSPFGQFVVSHSFGGRFDSFCLFPSVFSIENVIGKHFCNLNGKENREKCGDESFYCVLCRDLRVTAMQKSWRDRVSSVPMLRLTFMGLQMALPLIIVPTIARLPPTGPTQISNVLRILTIKTAQVVRADHIFDEGVYWNDQEWHESEKNRMLEKQNKATGADEKAEIVMKIELLNRNSAMLSHERAMALEQRGKVKEWTGAIRIIADLGIWKRIVEILTDETLQEENIEENDSENSVGKFRVVFIYLEQWAKNKHIYSDQFGLFNRKMLLVLLAKIFLLFPNSSIPFIIDKFFLTFSLWDWQMPVQLARIERNRRAEFLNWTTNREWFWKRQMAEENVMKSIRKETAMVVITPIFPEQNAASNTNLSTGKIIRWEMAKAREKIRETADINWPIREQKFTEKYDHFIVFICSGASPTVDEFSAFVGDRLRHELLEFVENPLAKYIRFCHMFPKEILTESCRKQSEAEQTNCEKHWVVGILPKTTNGGGFKGKLRAKLKKKNICNKILNDFKYPALMEIHSEYVEGREKLSQWFDANF